MGKTPVCIDGAWVLVDDTGGNYIRYDEAEQLNKGLDIKDGEIAAKGEQRYPMSAERELIRVNLSYVNSVNKVVQPYLYEILKAYKEQVREDSRFDDIGGFREKVSDFLEGMRKSVTELSSDALRGFVVKVGNIAFGNSYREWSRVMRNTLGARPIEKYYKDYMRAVMEQWVEENVSKITTLPDDYLKKVEEIVLWGYETHQPLVNVYNRIQKQLGTTKSYAKMLGRDQMGTLNAQMTQKEHESMGVTKYTWKTARDSRVRECHRQLDGKVFSWNNPPEMWYVTKSRGVVYTGRRCNPGEDYMCRCTAMPVFEKDVAEAKINEQQLEMLNNNTAS